MPHVAWISVAPVKGLALAHPEEVRLDGHGVAENRRFHLVDGGGRLFGLLRDGRLALVAAETDPDGSRLSLRFPDGSVVEGDVALGPPVTTDFFGRPLGGRLVEGPWAEALSDHAGRPVRLVRVEEDGGGQNRPGAGVSLLSQASVDRFAEEIGTAVDARRFRMLFGVAGAAPHEEDDWIGRRVEVGDAVVRILDAVARCAVTTNDPETGDRDLDTLRLIASYRGRDAAGRICFGVWGDVVSPGRVRLGDPVSPL